MEVEDEFPALGHFRGVAEENDIARLKSITGVESVKVTGDEGSQPGEEYTISTSET